MSLLTDILSTTVVLTVFISTIVFCLSIMYLNGKLAITTGFIGVISLVSITGIEDITWKMFLESSIVIIFTALVALTTVFVISYLNIRAIPQQSTGGL